MIKILLIEDNEDFRINTSEIIELANYQVVTAVNGVDGVKKAIIEQPDLIICDVMMPELDGYGVINILSKNPDTSGIPFIFLTAKAENSDVRKGMNLGADDYLLKPFDENTLLSSIETRLKRNQTIKNQIMKGLAGEVSEEITSGEEELNKLIENRKEKVFLSKEEIYREEDYANYIYFILEGKVKLFKSDNYGKNFVIDIHHKGDFFGYMALLESREHAETAMAMEECKVTIIPKEDFLKLVAKNREVSNKFIKLLAGNVREKEERLLQLAYSPVRERVARAIIHLADTEGELIDEKTQIKISRDDLANIVGTAKESLVRMLSEMKADEVLSLKGKEITILKPVELRKMVDFY